MYNIFASLIVMAIVGNVVRRWEFDSSASILFIGDNIHSPFTTTLNMWVWMDREWSCTQGLPAILILRFS